MSEDLWIKIGTKGKRGRAKKIICSICKKEILVRIKQKHLGICRECNAKRPKIKEGEIYIEWKGIKYRARKILCKDCKKEILVPLHRSHQGYCYDCNAKKLGDTTKIKNDEFFIVRKSGEKARATRHKCNLCGKEWLVRNDTILKTNFCKTCTLSENGKKAGSVSSKWAFKTGISIYRKIALNFFKNECVICGSKTKIQIHHIDCNKKNNDISNLVPLCNPCHKSVHWRIRKGLSYNEAIEAIKSKNMYTKINN